jgi:hypothetical protein
MLQVSVDYHSIPRQSDSQLLENNIYKNMSCVR